MRLNQMGRIRLVAVNETMESKQGRLSENLGAPIKRSCWNVVKYLNTSTLR